MERNPDADLPVRIRDRVSESVFRRSKTCYDCLWIARKKFPSEESGIAGPPDRPKPIFSLVQEPEHAKALSLGWVIR